MALEAEELWEHGTEMRASVLGHPRVEGERAREGETRSKKGPTVLL